MATISELYWEAKALRDERIAILNQGEPNGQLMREVNELKQIMDGLKNAFIQAGGSKATEPVTPE